MLRIIVLLLVLANALFYAWAQGWLGTVAGQGALGDREPGRLAFQIEPERVRVLPGPAGASAASAVLPPGAAPEGRLVCLEIGPYGMVQRAAAEAALLPLIPQNRIAEVKLDTQAVWIVFVGPYPDADARQKKADELKRLRVATEDIRRVPELGDGLSLGRFQDRDAAERALADLTARGVRTARVAQLSPPGATYMLRIDGVDLPLRAQLAGIQSPGLGGKSFSVCK